MKKTFLWSLIGILAAGLVIAGYWWMTRTQIIVLNNGTKLTLLGVTYGKHNIAPKFKIAGKRIRPNGARMDSTNDVAVVWIESQFKQNSWPNYQLVVSDPANTGAIMSGSQTQNQVRQGVYVSGFMLSSFPRRGSKMILRVLTYGNTGERLAKGHFVVANPARGSFPQWMADSLPDNQSDGDLSVTLTNFSINTSMRFNRVNGIPANDPMNKTMQVSFDIEQNNHSGTNWNPVNVELSDATGNDSTAYVNRTYQDGGLSYFFQPQLWPTEAAWKLRFQFSRTSGFDNNEKFSLSNVPVKQGTQQDGMMIWNYSNQNHPAFAETNVNDIQVKAYSAVEYDDNNNGMPNNMNGGNKVVSISFHLDPDPETIGMRLTPFEVTDDQGHAMQNWGSSWGGGNYGFQYRTSRTVTSVNYTIAVHKSRFVEFTVKPPK